jgi:hypothetical protein
MDFSLSAHHRVRCLRRLVLHALVILSTVVLTAKTINGQDIEAVPTNADDPESVSVATTGEEESAQDSSAEVPWYQRIQLGGDFRSRYEGFHQTGRETRNRTRFRLRLTVDSDINEDARFHVRVASGDPGTPVSTNQTFTSFFRPKPFSLNRAYLAYQPRAASALTLGIGKFGFPQNRTQMVFDDDLNVESGWEQVSWDLSDRVGINLGAVQTAVSEVSRDADAYMLAGYGEVHVETARAHVSLSAANYGWGNPDQIVAGHVDGPLNSILTNALERNDTGQAVGYTSRFNVVDVIAEATIQTGRPDYPIRMLADVAHNTRAASDRASGFWVEAGYGQPRLART